MRWGRWEWFVLTKFGLLCGLVTQAVQVNSDQASDLMSHPSLSTKWLAFGKGGWHDSSHSEKPHLGLQHLIPPCSLLFTDPWALSSGKADDIVLEPWLTPSSPEAEWFFRGTFRGQFRASEVGVAVEKGSLVLALGFFSSFFSSLNQGSPDLVSVIRIKCSNINKKTLENHG